MCLSLADLMYSPENTYHTSSNYVQVEHKFIYFTAILFYTLLVILFINTYRLLEVLLYNTGIYLDEYTA